MTQTVTVTIRKEVEPWSSTKVAFRAYVGGERLYISGETLAEVIDRVEHHFAPWRTAAFVSHPSVDGAPLPMDAA